MWFQYAAKVLRQLKPFSVKNEMKKRKKKKEKRKKMLTVANEPLILFLVIYRIVTACS